MRKTNCSNMDMKDRLLLNTSELQAVLGCGRAGAVRIGEEAQARVAIGTRVFWNREKLLVYLNAIAE